MQVATLVIAVFGAVVGASSLTWNIVSFLLSAGRAKIEFRVGAVVGSQYMTFAITENWRATISRALSLNERTGELAFFLIVRNVGRGAITVQNAGFRLPGDQEFGTIGGDDFQQRFPIKIDAGGPPVELVYRAEPIISIIQALPKLRPLLRARVELGTGRSVLSKRMLNVDEDEA